MSKKGLKQLIHSDLFRHKGVEVTRKQVISNFRANPGFKYMYLFRKCQFYKQKNYLMYRLYRFLLGRCVYKFGYEIPEEVKIGKGFYINHFGGITINRNAIIGENVNITKGVTIGQTNRGSKKGVPTIGNLVWIGANATIVGSISVGDNVLIAPNSYVNFDVPSNSIVIGNPAKIIKNITATEGYINNVV